MKQCPRLRRLLLGKAESGMSTSVLSASMARPAEGGSSFEIGFQVMFSAAQSQGSTEEQPQHGPEGGYGL